MAGGLMARELMPRVWPRDCGCGMAVGWPWGCGLGSGA